MDADIIIVGAGPAGLGLAAALAGAGLRLLVIERAGESELRAPADDGREIALTPASAACLGKLGAWSRLDPREISPLMQARVLNGASPYALDLPRRRPALTPLAHIVPNAAIRRALYDTVTDHNGAEVRTSCTAASLQVGRDRAVLALSDGGSVSASLVVAADTRFSALRRSQGIPAALRDFGRAMLVCRMGHVRPHDSVATEWFGLGQTIAMLPLNGNMSSLVLTLPEAEIARLRDLPPGPFAADMRRRTMDRWGALELVGERHIYPLVATYAERFVAPRFALVGDAAVGMHPVTAHGFNFGLRGAVTLADEVRRSHRAGGDVAAIAGLRRYETLHRRATLPLFMATNAIVALYGDTRPASRHARAAGLRIADRNAPVPHLIETGRRA
jgi:ubiquinone biosynthesis UbiH/UbiF/VisC/COQ6 family hydroxylase